MQRQVQIRQRWTRVRWFITAILIMLLTPVSSKTQTSIETGAHIYVQDPQPISVDYSGAQDITPLLVSGQARPLSLSAGDFNADGIQDLAAGYGMPSGGGIIVLHLGNLDAFAPQSHDSWLAIGQNRFPSPFTSTALAVHVPVVPDFLATGHFTGSDYTDIAVAARGGSVLYVLPGNGSGGFAQTLSIDLPGPVSALAAGKFSNNTDSNTIAVGIGGASPEILLYSGSGNGLSLVRRYSMSAPASSFNFDDLDGDGLADVLILSGGRLSLVHASGTSVQPELETISLPVSAIAATTGFFVHDRGWRRQIALLDDLGTVHIVAHGRFDSRGWTQAEIKTMREALWHRQPNPFRRLGPARAEDGWREIETIPALSSPAATGPIPILLASRISGQGTDDILVIDSQHAQLALAAHRRVKANEPSFAPARVSTRVYPGGIPVAAVSVRVNADARPGLILLNQGQIAPEVMMPVPDPTFWINRIDDPAIPLDGFGNPDPAQFCNNTSTSDTSSPCSLREAVIKANADANDFATPDTIMVDTGGYHLSIPGSGTTNATTGHLDITDPITIIGQGQNDILGTFNTQIIADAGFNDLVFLIDASEEGSIGFPTAISNLGIMGGRANAANSLVTSGGAIYWEAGTDGTGTLSLTNVTINGAIATDPSSPGLDDGGAMALFNTASVTSPAQVNITGSILENNKALDAGGAVALKGAISLTMTNSQVIGNQAVGGGIQQGGGLFLAVSNNPPTQPAGATSSPSFIQATTIANNTAGAAGKGEGGGIWTDQSLTINQGSVIQANDGEGAGGGIATGLTGTTDQVVISSSTIAGNRAPGGNGGGIEVDATSNANLRLSFNRIFNNTAAATLTGTGVANLGNGTVLATDNWWGCNQGPSTAPCDRVAGAAGATPWIVLTHTASPSTILNGASTTLTVSMLKDSAGNALQASNLAPLIGLPVSFNNAVGGTLSNMQTSIQSNGTATATFNASASGTGHADAVLDRTTQTASISVSDFSLTPSSSSNTVNVGTGSTATYSIAVTPINGFNSPVSLAATISPAGPSINLSTSLISGGSGTATLTATTLGSTPPGTNTITLT
jgi:hypothetical protein